jgi:hypothetical protein
MEVYDDDWKRPQRWMDQQNSKLAAFFVPLYAGRLHAGSNAREACSAGGGSVAGLFFR